MSLPSSKYEGPIRGTARVPPKLVLCRGCREFVQPDAVSCPHCGADAIALAIEHDQKLKAAYQAVWEVGRRLARLGVDLDDL